MSNVKDYKDCTSDEKQARKAFSYAVCRNCFAEEKGICNTDVYEVCLNAYTKGFARGVRHHRNYIKNKKK